MTNQIDHETINIFSISSKTRARNRKNGIILFIMGGIGTIASISMFFLVEGINVMGCGGISASVFLLLVASVCFFDKKGGKLSISPEGIHFFAANKSTLKWQDIESIEITNLPQQTKKVVYVNPKNIASEQRRVITDYYERFDEIIDLIRQQAKQNSVILKES